MILLEVVAGGTSASSTLFMIDVTSNIILINGNRLKISPKRPSNFLIFWARGDPPRACPSVGKIFAYSF
jgi:hypothetical protein